MQGAGAPPAKRPIRWVSSTLVALSIIGVVIVVCTVNPQSFEPRMAVAGRGATPSWFTELSDTSDVHVTDATPSPTPDLTPAMMGETMRQTMQIQELADVVDLTKTPTQRRQDVMENAARSNIHIMDTTAAPTGQLSPRTIGYTMRQKVQTYDQSPPTMMGNTLRQKVTGNALRQKVQTQELLHLDLSKDVKDTTAAPTTMLLRLDVSKDVKDTTTAPTSEEDLEEADAKGEGFSM
jgi:hypothetical protein